MVVNTGGFLKQSSYKEMKKLRLKRKVFLGHLISHLSMKLSLPNLCNPVRKRSYWPSYIPQLWNEERRIYREGVWSSSQSRYGVSFEWRNNLKTYRPTDAHRVETEHVAVAKTGKFFKESGFTKVNKTLFKKRLWNEPQIYEQVHRRTIFSHLKTWNIGWPKCPSIQPSFALNWGK